MATRQSNPQDPSSRASIQREHSLRLSHLNVFSDDFALEPLNGSAASSPIDPFASAHDSTSSQSSTPRPSISITRSVSNTSTNSGRPTSTRKIIPNLQNGLTSTPRQAVSTVSYAGSDTHRTSSTSSRFSIPRSQSPYVGANGPSHPYGMYPQVTRASSIASESTTRAIERPFFSSGGPEHPYAMYSQNTVPEEADTLFPPLTIPIGFPGLGEQYQSRVRTARDDIADIVGADGHVEELPPYSRYANDAAAKETMGATVVSVAVADPSSSQTDVPFSSPSFQALTPNTNVALDSGAADSSKSLSSGSFKERWKEKSRKRLCLGLPLWIILGIIGIVLFAGVVGGIIGGVVGNKKGAATADAQEAHESATAAVTVTTTSYLDATPLPTNQPMPTVPSGQYNFRNTNIQFSSNSCVADSTLVDSWGCEPPLGIGITLTNQDQGGQQIPQMTVDPYPVNSSFRYGPQPPDLQGTSWPMYPSIDKWATNLGPSLFFSTLYDKLVILPEHAMTGSPSKRSTSNTRFSVRDRDDMYHSADVGDNPWFCWFNNTLLEFFIYVDQNTSAASLSSTSSPTALVPTSTISSSKTVASSTGTDYMPGLTSPPTGFPSSMPEIIASSWPYPSFKQKRYESHGGNDDYDDAPPLDCYPDYPRQIKMSEKRVPTGPDYIQPYCQQMTICSDLTIVPLAGVNVIEIPETMPPPPPPPPSRRSYEGSEVFGASLAKRQDPPDLCICEWINT